MTKLRNHYSKLAELKEILDPLIDENIQLRNENEILRSQIENNSVAIENLKQDKFAKTFEISGVPNNNDIETGMLAAKLLQELDIKVELGDIKEAFVVPHQSTNSGSLLRLFLK